MIVDVPEGQDPIIHVWGVMVPGIGPAAATGARPRHRRVLPSHYPKRQTAGT